MSLSSFFILLLLSLICLGCAIFSLVGSTEWRRSFYIVWVVFAAMLVYGVFCYASLAYWRKRIREKSLVATRKESHDRADEIFRAHKQIRILHHERVPNASTRLSAASLPPVPCQDSSVFNRSHPGPLTSNPPYGSPTRPPSHGPYLPPLPRNLSDLALSPPFHAASTLSLTAAKPRAIQIPARSRAATDTGKPSKAATAAGRTRANSVKHIRAATARRISKATPLTPLRSPSQEAFPFDN